MYIPELSRQEKAHLAARLVQRFVPHLEHLAKIEPTVEGKLFYLDVAEGGRGDAARLWSEAHA